MRGNPSAWTPRAASRLAVWWRAFSSPWRRRIVLGVLLGLALALRDIVLLLVAGALFALAEAAPAGRPVARPAS